MLPDSKTVVILCCCVREGDFTKVAFCCVIELCIHAARLAYEVWSLFEYCCMTPLLSTPVCSRKNHVYDIPEVIFFKASLTFTT